MMKILPVASGKGGVGKSIFSTNLAVSLAKSGKTVILIDLDLGGANLHTCLGIKGYHPGIGNLISKQFKDLDSLLIETSIENLFFIPGDSLIPGAANLSYQSKMKIFKEIKKLVADFVILDLGSGSSYNTIDFFLASLNGIVITTSEATSILNAYSFIKTSLFRYIYRSFQPKSEERNILTEFIKSNIENNSSSFHSLLNTLKHLNKPAGQITEECIKTFSPRVVLSMCRNYRDLEIGIKLKNISKEKLMLDIEYLGYLAFDSNIPFSLLKGNPVRNMDPSLTYSKNIDVIANKIIYNTGNSSQPKMFEDEEDLIELNHGSIQSM